MDVSMEKREEGENKGKKRKKKKERRQKEYESKQANSQEAKEEENAGSIILAECETTLCTLFWSMQVN